MKKIVYVLALIILISACGQPNSRQNEKKNKPTEKVIDTQKSLTNNQSTIDSVDKANNESIIMSGGKVTKAYVFSNDSSISLTANMRADHRFFGYAKPDTQSERLLLLSIFTNDVENNPYKCKLGSFYDTGGMEYIDLKYQGTTGNFIKVTAVDNVTSKSTIIYFEKKWIEFFADK